MQTSDKIAIVGEENLCELFTWMGQRDRMLFGLLRHSVGHWEGETLVVETTHYNDTIPHRATTGRPMLISSKAGNRTLFESIETELHYQYTVRDPEYYTDEFRGVFLIRDDLGISMNMLAMKVITVW